MLVNRSTLPRKFIARKWMRVALLVGVCLIFLLNSALLFDQAEKTDDETSTAQQKGAPRRFLKSLNGDSLTQRQLYERDHFSDPSTRLQAAQTNRDPAGEPQQRDDIPYDIFHCPPEPPVGYPKAWNIVDVLDHWNSQDIQIPKSKPFHHGLCVFDWQKQKKEAATYRERELPFILKNHPDVLETSDRWLSPGYMEGLMGDRPMLTETTTSSYFAFARPGLGSGTIEEPLTQRTMMSYPEFLTKSQTMEEFIKARPDGTLAQAHLDHWYFRLNGSRKTGQNPFLYDELPFLDDTNEDSFFIVEGGLDRGIHCRLGMAGVTFPMHFDYDRNFIAVFGGKRRLILASPDQCKGMTLHGEDHPSARHSKWNWANVSHATAHTLPEDYRNAMVNEVVLQAGDVLYLPTFWFHMVISLGLNYQCNARSGETFENKHHMQECGFHHMREEK